MGSATSKPARKLGAQTVTQAKPGSLPGTARPQNQAPVVAELSSRFEKDQSILDDAKDPQLLRNLDALGPVQAKDIRAPVSPSGTMLHVIQARAMTEPTDEKPAAVQGLSAGEVLRLLADYQAAPSSETLDRLAIEYDVDRPLIGKLVQFVQAPEEQPMP